MRRHASILITACLAAMTVGACATTTPTRYELAPMRSNGHDLKGMDARTTLESRQPGGIVSVRADQQFEEFGAGFIIVAQNKSAGALEFGPQNIQASINGKPLAVLTADELDTKVQGKLRGYVRATSTTSQQDILAASEEATRDYRFNNYGGCPAGQGSCQVFSDDNGSIYRQDRIARELQAKTVAEVATKLQQSKVLIAQKALRPSRIEPEQMAGGIMVVELPPSGGSVDLTITFNGHKHNFTFAATPGA